MPLLMKSIDPFDPAARTVERIPKNRRIAAMCPTTNRPVVCLYNGKPLLRAGWKRKVKHGDTVAFVAMPRGKNFGQILSFVVMAVVAFYIAPQMAYAMKLGTVGTAVLTAGLSAVGLLMVNLPASDPETHPGTTQKGTAK